LLRGAATQAVEKRFQAVILGEAKNLALRQDRRVGGRANHDIEAEFKIIN